MANMTDEQVKMMLVHIEGKKEIYVSKHKLHKDKHHLHRVWKGIGKKLKIDPAICRLKWKNLFSSLKRKFQTSSKTSKFGRSRKPWKWQQEMDFAEKALGINTDTSVNLVEAVYQKDDEDELPFDDEDLGYEDNLDDFHSDDNDDDDGDLLEESDDFEDYNDSNGDGEGEPPMKLQKLHNEPKLNINRDISELTDQLFFQTLADDSTNIQNGRKKLKFKQYVIELVLHHAYNTNSILGTYAQEPSHKNSEADKYT